MSICPAIYGSLAANISSSASLNEYDSISRRLQFENMFESQKIVGRSKRGKKSMQGSRVSRAQALQSTVDHILQDMDRYHMWWTGPVNEADPNFLFAPAEWSSAHNPSANAIFTMAVIQGKDDQPTVSTPNNLALFLGSARRVFQGDIVIAVESDNLSDAAKAMLAHYKAVVYLLPKNLCEKETRSIFCGSEDERVPASVFRYYFYEKWASIYTEKSLIMLSDFRDVFFQADPFVYHNDEWLPEYQLSVFQEFHPNMIINRCHFNTKTMLECYGEDALRTLGNRIIISSGGILGTRDGVLVWSRQMTQQLQDAPGRQVETRCFSGGIDHSFINWLVYGNKLRQTIKIRIYNHGEGAMNTVGGLRPDTVLANITGPIRSYWKLLNNDGHLLNWNGEVMLAYLLSTLHFLLIHVHVHVHT